MGRNSRDSSQPPSHVVLVRFSAMGDVAMSIPVVYDIARAWPTIHFTFVTKLSMRDIFVSPPENLSVVAVDPHEYPGVRGMWRLYREIDRSRHIDAVADLHDVIRSRLFRLAGRLHGARVASIDKGRADKRRLTRAHHKVMRCLPTSAERYREVLDRLGLSAPAAFVSLFSPGKGLPEVFAAVTPPKREGEVWIGIAPFAAHKGKIYPPEKMEEVVAALSRLDSVRLFFFGGGEKEKAILGEWARRYPRAVSLAERRYGFPLELALQSYLDVMVCMDSGNMHLASLAGVPTVSVWGATHPCCGFTALRQSPQLIVQTDMECRPCSVFGNRPCRRGDYACMTSIAPQTILERVRNFLRLPEVPEPAKNN